MKMMYLVESRRYLVLIFVRQAHQLFLEQRHIMICVKHKSISQEAAKPTMHFSDSVANCAALFEALRCIDILFAPL